MTKPDWHIGAQFMSMPRACISCTQYEHLGWDHDDHCPFKSESALGERKTRTPFGRCALHGQEVFGTQICNNYDADPQVNPTPVENRPVARAPIQETMGVTLL